MIAPFPQVVAKMNILHNEFVDFARLVVPANREEAMVDPTGRRLLVNEMRSLSD